MAKLTAAEMQYEAKLIYESIVSGDAPGYTPREWSELLTQAQEFEIKEIIENGFDKNEMNRKSIDRLIKHADLSTIVAGNLGSNSYRVDLEEDYYHVVNKYANLTESTQDRIKVVPMSHQAYKSNINNPFRKPFIDDNNNEGEVWELVYNDDSGDRQIEIITPDGYVLANIYLDYLKDPRPIIIASDTYSATPDIASIEGEDLADHRIADGPWNCELSSIVQRKIVQRAANLAAAYTRDRIGYQMQKTEEGSQTNQPQRK